MDTDPTSPVETSASIAAYRQTTTTPACKTTLRHASRINLYWPSRPLTSIHVGSRGPRQGHPCRLPRGRLRKPGAQTRGFPGQQQDREGTGAQRRRTVPHCVPAFSPSSLSPPTFLLPLPPQATLAASLACSRRRLDCFTSLCCCVRTEEHALVGHGTRLFPLILILTSPLPFSLSLSPSPSPTTHGTQPRARVLLAILAPSSLNLPPHDDDSPAPTSSSLPRALQNLSW
ncbi:hypothetical protein BGZ61DRAFT_190394 [Ilyonectria robusta]|uniref:uncharacterized protein n=1 Tax=Ilyonectria robusta TaxID=1079257 RepID=UPI001E8D777D|nr:uncharacterized protein BGZ61DRAFT_190394 [Ilyonectria robusta]KAH8656397.1 hypothetical protein BGZ61DRAFT_190394 [Ilyonectria robusta]